MKRSHYRIIILALILTLALVSTTVAAATSIYLLTPNPDLLDDAPVDGKPDFWKVLGDAQSVPLEFGEPGDEAVLFPDTDRTSAAYQTHAIPDFELPSSGCMWTGYVTKQLTPLTSFFGLIISYDDGSVARVYKAHPAGSHNPLVVDFLPFYLSSSVDSLKIGSVYFGKRGSGWVVIDYMGASKVC